MKWAALTCALLVACGDPSEPAPYFEVVGHSDLGARGMNSALAIAGGFAYVGARSDNEPILIVDIADPARPAVVGALGMPAQALPGMSSRELRAVGELDLLVVLNLVCSPDLHGCDVGAAEIGNFKFYDISDRVSPRLVASHPVQGTGLRQRNPHEFFLWRDPNDRARVLVLLAAPGEPSLEILSVSAGTPTSVMMWSPYNDGGLPRIDNRDNILHSIATSDDGRTAYASHQVGGLFAIDLSQLVDSGTPALVMLTPPAQALKFGVTGPHSAVPVPGRPLLVATEEIYPQPFSVGCPWGHLRTVDISDVAQPVVVGEYKLPENDPGCAADAPSTAFTSHNPTVTANVALVTWYAGGLQAIDISDPMRPTQLAELRPEPIPSVIAEDPGLGGSAINMWSYPVIKDGLIYVVDIRNGLYVLRYHGRFEDEITQTRFNEGNSNLRD